MCKPLNQKYCSYDRLWERVKKETPCLEARGNWEAHPHAAAEESSQARKVQLCACEGHERMVTVISLHMLYGAACSGIRLALPTSRLQTRAERSAYARNVDCWRREPQGDAEARSERRRQMSLESRMRYTIRFL